MAHVHECPKCNGLHRCKNKECDGTIGDSLCQFCWVMVSNDMPDIDVRGISRDTSHEF